MVKSKSAYSVPTKKGKLGTHIFVVWVDNETGVLARVVGLFSGRGYNIESLAVAEIDQTKNISGVIRAFSKVVKIKQSDIERIVENIVSVPTSIKRSRDLKNIETKQVVQFVIDSPNLQITNPDETIKTLILQNSNLNNPISNLKPQYTIGSQLIYRYDKPAAFDAGNEFLFQMQAMMNIEVMNAYEVKKIVSACPHCFNTIKNEYPELGGMYEVMHHTEFIKSLLNDGKLTIEGGQFKGKRITFHDPCYLGRANNVYEAPRDLIQKLDAELVEMKRSRANGLCCGAGGAQMFKEPEKGNKDINIERTEDALELQPEIIAAGCPFCNTMLTDGIKNKNKEASVQVLDVAELIANAQDL